MKHFTILQLLISSFFVCLLGLTQANAQVNALAFDGINDYVEIPTNTTFQGMTSFTVEMWAKGSELATGNKKLISYTTNGGATQGFDFGYSNGQLFAEIFKDWSGNRLGMAGGTLTADTWYHVALTWDGSTLRSYINGVEVANSTIGTIGTGWQASQRILLGATLWSGNEQYCNIVLNEIRIWNVVRTQSEINSARFQNISTSTSGLIAYYKCNQGIAGGDNTAITNLTDATTNAFNGTLTNFARTGTASNFVSSDHAMPVELTTFTANTNGSVSTLNWNTATEVNNYGFEVEKQSSINNWQKIGFVEGNGTTNSPKSYSFVDKSASGKISYRLKQIDRDGKFEYSKTVEVTSSATPKEFALTQNYPNPFNPTTVISYQLPVSDYVSLKVFDMLGREVAVLVNEVKEAGTYTARFDGSTLSSGIYFAKLTSAGKTQMIKLLLMK